MGPIVARSAELALVTWSGGNSSDAQIKRIVYLQMTVNPQKKQATYATTASVVCIVIRVSGIERAAAN